jgi:hypothetical protein
MGILDLWLPVLASAVLMFVASSVIWMFVRWHNSDYRQTRDEEAVRSALSGAEPGFYLLPYCMDPAEFKRPEIRQKFEAGPLAYITVVPNGVPNMAPRLVGMFLFFLLVGVLSAYFVSRTLAPDAAYLEVFRIAGTAAFVANGIAVIPESLWYGRPWPMTFKYLLDALIYGLLTGGVFGWLA